MGPASKVTEVVIEPGALGSLLSCLVSRGYCPVGPTLRDGSIVYDTLSRLEDLPAGWTDEQSAGEYRLRRGDNGALFGFTVGPQSWKKFLHPPEIRLYQIERAVESHDKSVRILPDSNVPLPYAFIGVRACELAAIRIHDRVLLQDKFIDPVYQARRQSAFLVAVNCTRSGATCFCASLGTGPGVRRNFDLLLTEIFDNGRHLFVAQSGSQKGAEILAELPQEPATPEISRRAAESVERAAEQSRKVDSTGLKELLTESFYHPRWDQVAERCLAGANCTLVCPTCFCTIVEDSTSLTGDHAERWRRWDSCFSQTFSYIHGGSVRKSVKSRYRQWLTHKFSSWIDQFGSPGCVGCGRCITWCPARIDITEEVRAIQSQKMPGATFVEDEDGNA